MKRVLYVEGDGAGVWRTADKYTAELAVHIKHPRADQVSTSGSGVHLEVDPDGSWVLTAMGAWDDQANRQVATVVASGQLGGTDPVVFRPADTTLELPAGKIRPKMQVYVLDAWLTVRHQYPGNNLPVALEFNDGIAVEFEADRMVQVR